MRNIGENVNAIARTMTTIVATDETVMLIKYVASGINDPRREIRGRG